MGTGNTVPVFFRRVDMQYLMRTGLVLGEEALTRIRQSRVIVCGLGGVGGAAAEALARSGIGHLKLIDGDIVEPTNLNRQLVALQSTIGQDKCLAMATRLKEAAPLTQVEAVKVMLTPLNLVEYIKDTDYVVDCIDDLNAKTALIVYCLKNQIPIVSSMGAGGRVDPTLIRKGDISETNTDPLAKVMRHRLKEQGIEKGLKVVYSLEKPVKAKEVAGKITIGSTAFVPPATGLALASLVILDLIK
jgi:tRNA A37 threonylcarbamoyladenosine dehydratase